MYACRNVIITKSKNAYKYVFLYLEWLLAQAFYVSKQQKHHIISSYSSYTYISCIYEMFCKRHVIQWHDFIILIVSCTKDSLVI